MAASDRNLKLIVSTTANISASGLTAASTSADLAVLTVTTESASAG
jgi:hypothetical protein